MPDILITVLFGLGQALWKLWGGFDLVVLGVEG